MTSGDHAKYVEAQSKAERIAQAFGDVRRAAREQQRQNYKFVHSLAPPAASIVTTAQPIRYLSTTHSRCRVGWLI
jgi:hypothetical protein